MYKRIVHITMKSWQGTNLDCSPDYWMLIIDVACAYTSNAYVLYQGG